MTTSPTPEELRTWSVYTSATIRLMERLDHELQQRSNISITDYEILSSLAESSDHKMRMSELAQQVLVSRSRLTYRVDRLVEVGYIEREECEDDRRGLWALLTETGNAALLKSTPGHNQDLKNWFFDNLDKSEFDTLSSAMSRIEDKLTSNR